MYIHIHTIKHTYPMIGSEVNTLSLRRLLNIITGKGNHPYNATKWPRS